jgi:hypothetical protein
VGKKEIVLQEEIKDGEEAKIGGQNREVCGKEIAKENRNDSEERQPDVEERENPEETANIKGAEIVLGSAGVEEDAANQESREDEEKIHARPTEAEGGAKAIQKSAKGTMLTVVQIMERNHKQYGDPAKAIELGDTARKERKIPCLRDGRGVTRVKGIHGCTFRAIGK